MGGNETLARMLGGCTKVVTSLIYTILGLMAAIAGMFLSSRLSLAQPDAGTLYEMDAMLLVGFGGTSLAGGKGRIFGTLIGLLIIGTLNNGMNCLGILCSYVQIV